MVLFVASPNTRWLWQTRDHPDVVANNPDTNEHVEFYQLKGVNALASFKGSVDMLKAVVTKTPKTQEAGS